MKKICTFNENADNILAFLQLMALVIILGPSPKEKKFLLGFLKVFLFLDWQQASQHAIFFFARLPQIWENFQVGCWSNL